MPVPFLFWMDIAALSISTLLAFSLIVIVLGYGFSHALARAFALFVLLETLWAIFSLLFRLALWLEKGNPLFWAECATLAVALMGPILLLFTVCFLDRRNRAHDLSIIVGVLFITMLGIPLFRHQLVFNPHLDANGSTKLVLSDMGMVVAAIPAIYMGYSLFLFWLDRHRVHWSLLGFSVSTLFVGFVVGGILEVAFPVLSVTNTASVAMLGYAVISRQLFNPLREKTTALQREVSERLRVECAIRKNEQILAHQTQELTRYNAFLSALSRVAARIETTRDPDQVVETLGQELKQLDFDTLVAMLEPEDEAHALIVHYISLAPKVLRDFQELVGFTLRGYRVPQELKPIDEILAAQRAFFEPDALKLLLAVLPSMPRAKLERALGAIGIDYSLSALYLPLVVEEQLLGMLCVWGSDLRQADIAPFSIFASQVAGVIENARLLTHARREVQARSRAQEQIQASLYEKELLLKEIHHRVKNNLQVISSLLNFQSLRINDAQVLDMIKDSQNRIRSMALVHERLYRSPNFAKVQVGDYVERLIPYLIRTYNVNVERLTLKVDTQDIELGIDSAIPFGLILNELVSNVLKHAFPVAYTSNRDVDAMLWIRLWYDEPEFTLIVRDNGQGFPEDVDFRNTDTVGLQLVNMLVRQLSGTISLDTSSGTQFEITFSEPNLGS